MKRLPILARCILVVAWAMFLIAPMAFLFNRSADTNTALDWFAGIYDGFVGLFGEQIGRWLFCGSWLALNALVLWGVMLSKDRAGGGSDFNLDG